MPLEVTLPDSAMMRFDPRLWICSATRAWAPAPTPTIAVEPLQERERLDAGARIEGARGLVGEDHGRIVDERAGDRDALLLAARELARLMVLTVGERQGGEARPGAGAAVAGGHTRVEQGQLDVLEGGRPGEEVELLEDEADLRVPDPRERVRGEAGNVLAVDDVATGGRRVEAPEEVHEGGLPGTRRSHHRDELTVLDRHRDPAERVDRVRPQVVVLRQAFGGDDRSGHDYSLRRGPLCGWGAPRTRSE